MEKTALIINPGSASRKYALYRGTEELARAHFEKENGAFVFTLWHGAREEKNVVSDVAFADATKYFVDTLISKNIIPTIEAITVVGVRVVAPGEYFASHRAIDDAYITRLRESIEEAPLHINPALKEIENIKITFPTIPLIGVSDSAFHVSMARPARHYALSKEIVEPLGMYRYGYHGISAESIVRQVPTVFGEMPSKIVICHMGSGSSIMAVHDGKSFDTSMGFTPLEGMIMATRVGDIDAGALIYLQKKLNMTPDALNEYVNTKCGLLGVSGKSADTRALIELEKTGDVDAALALELLAYRVKKYIGAYAAALNGIDALIFAGTIGERSYIMRSRMCAAMDFLGIKLDETKNTATVSVNGLISTDDSRCKIAVMMTNEMSEMARITFEITA